LLSQLKEYGLGITAVQERRWQGKDLMDMKSHTLFYSGKEEGTREFGVAFIAERSMKRYVLDFKAVDERMCLKDKNKIPQHKFHKCACSHRRKGRDREGSFLSESGRSI
jgi:hypothetical protein